MKNLIEIIISINHLQEKPAVCLTKIEEHMNGYMVLLGRKEKD